jgi:tubulin epsilon
LGGLLEILFLQIGQCGNQIEWKFWQKVLEEHVRYNAMSSDDQSFFEICDKGSFATLNKVWAVLIDTQLNTATKLEQSSIGRIFQCVLRRD